MANFITQGIQVVQKSYAEWRAEAQAREAEREAQRDAEGGKAVTQGMWPEDEAILPKAPAENPPVLKPRLTPEQWAVLKQLKQEGHSIDAIREMAKEA